MITCVKGYEEAMKRLQVPEEDRKKSVRLIKIKLIGLITSDYVYLWLDIRAKRKVQERILEEESRG